MEITGFETEAYKLMISDILSATKEEEDGDFLVALTSSDLMIGNGRTKSLSQEKKLILRVRLVWIQGHITEISREGGQKCLVISDGEGEARILGSDSVSGGEHSDIRIGTYIGILGQIFSTNPLVQVKAVKVMAFRDRPALESIWNDEVKYLKVFLLGMIKPETCHS